MSNDYDDMKKWISIGRQLQESISNKNTIKEQLEPSSQVAQSNLQKQQPGAKEKNNIANINGVDIYIKSSDKMDLDLKEDEKGKISQMIDEFKKDIPELTDLSKITVMPNTVKMEGSIPTYSLQFIYSAGEDRGLYLTNLSMLKIDEQIMTLMNKLLTFENKYISVTNDMLSYRNDN
jgi:hypothetical protein